MKSYWAYAMGLIFLAGWRYDYQARVEMAEMLSAPLASVDPASRSGRDDGMFRHKPVIHGEDGVDSAITRVLIAPGPVIDREVDEREWPDEPDWKDELAEKRYIKLDPPERRLEKEKVVEETREPAEGRRTKVRPVPGNFYDPTGDHGHW